MPIRNNPNPTDYPIHELFAQRWSPRAMTGQPVAIADMHAILEAGRWAPSCMGAEPWRFMVGLHGTKTHNDLLETLMMGNKIWCDRTGALVLVCAVKEFANGQANTYAWHDVGLCVGQMLGQATSLGYGIHCMAGFDRAKVIDLLQNDALDPVEILAIGKHDDIDVLPNDDLKARELAERKRIPQADLVLNSF